MAQWVKGLAIECEIDLCAGCVITQVVDSVLVLWLEMHQFVFPGLRVSADKSALILTFSFVA